MREEDKRILNVKVLLLENNSFLYGLGKLYKKNVLK